MAKKDMKESMDIYDEFDGGISVKLTDDVFKKQNLEKSEASQKLEKTAELTHDKIDHIEVSSKLKDPMASVDVALMEKNKKNNNFLMSNSIKTGEPENNNRMTDTVDRLLDDMKGSTKAKEIDENHEAHLDTINDKDDEDAMFFNPITKGGNKEENDEDRKRPGQVKNKPSDSISQMLRSLDNRHSKLADEDDEEEEKQNLNPKDLRSIDQDFSQQLRNEQDQSKRLRNEDSVQLPNMLASGIFERVL